MKMKHAFSLVELSIVLVILGLLVGGILSGQSLIRAAELRSITTEFDRYASSINSFRDKYFALPGDMANATSFWGKDASQCNGQPGNAMTPGTCNGNGNGIYEYGSSANTSAEPFRAWQQLALAGLIEGTYTGNAGGFVDGNPIIGAADHDPGSNCPASRMPSVGWAISYLNNIGGYPFIFSRDYRNWMNVGIDQGTGNFLDEPFLKPEEAWNIDTKIDDGKPGQGKVNTRANNGAANQCTNATGNTDFSASYVLSNSGKECQLLINPN